MNITDDQLQSMIQKTQFAKPGLDADEHWYSFPNQKVLAYNLAQDLVLSGEDIDTSIETAKTFIDTFYTKAIRPHSWER
jgi:hypothetical protein